MNVSTKEATRPLGETPWGLLPPRLRVLYVTTARRTGAWLAEAFAGDSACQVSMQESRGASAALTQLRDQVFDAVLIGHEPPQLDAFELLDALHGSGAEESLIVLGQPSEQELAAQCYEAGADHYLCVNTATTRNLLWVVARATERRQLIRENRRLTQAERHRLRQEHRETERMLSEQRGVIRDAQSREDAATDPPCIAEESSLAALGRRVSGVVDPPASEALKCHYRELLRAHVIMGSGNLAGEMQSLAEQLAAGNITAPQTMSLHVQVLEELVQGLGSRSARHVMTRADLLVLEVLVHLAESYRLRQQQPSLAALAAHR